MKIIYTLNNFLPQQVAGTEVYVLTLAKEMQRIGNDVTILIPNFEKFENDTYVFESLKVIKFAEPTVLNRGIIAGNIIPDGVVNFIKIVKDIQPDIIHFHTIGGSNGVSIHHLREAKKINTAIVLTFHLAGYTCITNNLLYKNKIPCNGFVNILKCTKCVYTDKGLGSLKKNILFKIAAIAFKLNYNTRHWNNSIGTAISYPFVIKENKTKLLEMVDFADKIIVLTKWYKNVLEINGITSQKLYYIPQGVPGQPLIKVLNNNSIILKLVFVGRISETKGLHLLIKAIEKIPVGEISLDIFGPVNDEIYARKWIKYSASNKNIKWMGVIQPSEMVPTLANYDLLCLPSIICEMSPLVIQEAFAAGLPVIASNVYGNAEQITEGVNGWLFEFNNSIHLAEKLTNLINNYSLIDQARLNLPIPYNFNSIALEHIKLYKEVSK